MTDELITWLRAQLEEDEQWALAASRPYEYADEGSKTPAAGVHWQWVTGERGEPVTPDPVLNEFVAEPGHSCNLVTVEEWPVTSKVTDSTTSTRMRRRPLADSIVEMDSSAARHIVRHDPARVLAEVEAKRRILAEYERYASERRRAMNGWDPEARNPSPIVRFLALPYADRPGYLDEWRP